MAGKGFDIVIGGDYKEVLRVFRKIQRDNRRGIHAGLRDISLNARNFLIAYYKGGGTGPPLAEGTRLKRKFGKLAGAGGPHIPAYGGVTSLKRSGALIRNLFRRPSGKLRFIIGINNVMGEFAGYPTLPLPVIAALQEEGYVHTVPFTKRMQAYLLLLYGRITSVEQAGAYRWRPRNLLVRVPPRPVWGRTWKQIVPQAGHWMLTSWATELGLSGAFAHGAPGR